MLNRRAFISTAGLVCAGHLVGAEAPHPRGVPLRQEPLTFDFDEFEPYLDAATLRAHYHGYHGECLAQLRRALSQANLCVGNVVTLMPAMHRLLTPANAHSRLSFASKKTVPEPLADEVVQAIRLYGGAHINHTAFWRCLGSPLRRLESPRGKLAAALQAEFGSLKKLRSAFVDAAERLPGSGWAWLTYRYDGRLIVHTTENEDNPLMTDYVAWQEQGKPLLCVDLWEHSYTRRYQTDRRRYIHGWWKCVNWEAVERHYAIVTAA